MEFHLSSIQIQSTFQGKSIFFAQHFMEYTLSALEVLVEVVWNSLLSFYPKSELFEEQTILGFTFKYGHLLEICNLQPFLNSPLIETLRGYL